MNNRNRWSGLQITALFALSLGRSAGSTATHTSLLKQDLITYGDGKLILTSQGKATVEALRKIKQGRDVWRDLLIDTLRRERATVELGEAVREYVEEAEHQDGRLYWQAFETAEDMLKDLDCFVQIVKEGGSFCEL